MLQIIKFWYYSLYYMVYEILTFHCHVINIIIVYKNYFHFPSALIMSMYMM